MQHDFSHGLYAQVSYTFSKLLADTTSENVYWRNREKAINGADRPHVVTLSYIYDLPVGHGKAFGANMHPVLDAFIGGWKVSAVQHYQSGAVLSISCGQNMYGAGAARCNYVPGQPLYNPVVESGRSRTVRTSTSPPGRSPPTAFTATSEP